MSSESKARERLGRIVTVREVGGVGVVVLGAG